MSKEELQEIINYGADEIFRTGTDVTEEDIEALIDEFEDFTNHTDWDTADYIGMTICGERDVFKISFSIDEDGDDGGDGGDGGDGEDGGDNGGDNGDGGGDNNNNNNCYKL